MSSWVQKTPNGRWKARYRAPDGRTRSKTWDLLVNEIGAYDGIVLVESGLVTWDVSADGDWTVTC